MFGSLFRKIYGLDLQHIRIVEIEGIKKRFTNLVKRFF